MTIGKKLYVLRKSKGWSQDYVASYLNISRQSVSKWELDDNIPEYDNLAKLSELFEVSIDYLLKDKEETAEEKNSTEPTANTNKRFSEKFFGVLSLLSGVIIIGVLFSLCTVIPARIEYTSIVYKDDIAFVNPEVTFSVPDESVVTSSFRGTHNFLAFLSTYYLHWLVILAIALIIYGLSTLIKLSKKERKGEI